MKSTLLGNMPNQGVAGKADKPPNAHDRVMENATQAKVHATDAWVRGEISSAKHKQIHTRADKVIKAKGKMK